jgi:hypothetical protein
VCLSFSAFHPELWQPAWGIRLILEALIAFLETPHDGAIGALNASAAERRRLAKLSVDFCCPTCGPIRQLLLPIEDAVTATAAPRSAFSKEIQRLQQLQMQNHQLPEEDAAADSPAVDQSEEGKSNAPAPAAVEEPSDAQASTLAQAMKSIMEQYEQENGQEQPKNDEKSDEPAKQMAVNEPLPPPAVAPPPPAPVVAAAPRPAVAVEDASGRWVWVVDPLLQLSIAILGVICFMMLQTIDSLLDELRKLDDLNE